MLIFGPCTEHDCEKVLVINFNDKKMTASLGNGIPEYSIEGTIFYECGCSYSFCIPGMKEISETKEQKIITN